MPLRVGFIKIPDQQHLKAVVSQVKQLHLKVEDGVAESAAYKLWI